LRPDTAFPELVPQRFRIIALIRRDDFETFAWATPFAGAELHRIEQRQDLGTLILVGRRDAIGQRHSLRLCEAVDENALAFPPVGDALATPLARGKKRHPRRHTPNELSLSRFLSGMMRL